MKKYLISTCIFFACSVSVFSQNTFQKVYDCGNDQECFGCYQTIEGNYIFTGIVNAGGYKVYMTLIDCEGNVLWNRTYNSSSTVGNISHRVIQTHDHGFLLAASSGTFGSYNIMLVKTDGAGNTMWHKILNGSRDDVVNSVIETKDFHYLIAGKTNSYGQELSTPSGYSDIYIAKVDSSGNFLWGKTYGTAQTVDEAFDIIETADSGYAAAGRCIAQGTFYSFLMKTDSGGTVDFIKAYGDTNQSTNAYSLIQTYDGGFAVTGSSTIMKNSYQDYADEFIIKTNAVGDTMWTRTYHGTNNDGSENASSILSVIGGYVIAVATMSYPTTGFVPNKHLAIKTDLSGNLLFAQIFNNGGSHYPFITKPLDGYGYLLSGFTTNYTSYFSTIIIRTDNFFTSGCNETDVTSATIMEYPPFHVLTPAINTASGGALTNSTVQGTLTDSVIVLCENIIDSCSNNTSGLTDEIISCNMTVHFNQPQSCITIQRNDVAGQLAYEIFDAAGNVLQLGKPDADKIVTGKISSGIYLLKLSNGKRFWTFRFVKHD